MTLIRAADESESAGGGIHGIRALDTTTRHHEAGRLSVAPAATHTKAVRISARPATGAFRRRFSSGVGVDVPRYGRGPGASAASITRDDRAVAELPWRVRR